MSTNRESQLSMDELSSRISSLSPAKRALLELKLKKGAGSTQTIPHRVTGETAPLSFSQQRLWFINQLDPESAVYNIVRAIRLNGTLDVTALRQSLDAIVDRHESVIRDIVRRLRLSPRFLQTRAREGESNKPDVPWARRKEGERR